LRIGGSSSWSIVHLESGRGQNGKVTLTGMVLLCLPTVWEGLGIQLGDAEHFLEFGVV